MRKITVQRAAAILGKSPLFVRESMRRGTLPIGTAEQLPGSSRWSFIISPQALADYLGCPVSELYEEEDGRPESPAFSEDQIRFLCRTFEQMLRGAEI